MIALYILIPLILILLTVYFGITKSLFKFAIKRDDTPKSFDKETLVNQGLEKYADEIISARNEFLLRDFEVVSVISDDGLTLKGLLHESNDAKGTIILFHGYRSSPDIDFCVAEKFYEGLGLNVLMPYQRAHGLSEGQYITYGIKERFDVLKWIEFINNRYGYQQNIFLSGLSMGSSTVLMSADKSYPDNVKLIIADCGFTSPFEIFEHVVKTTMKIPFKLFIPLFDRMCRKKASFSVREFSTVDALKKCTVPVFFIHGEADKFVPPAMTEKNYEACASEKYILRVPNAPHAVSFMFDDGKYKQTLKMLISKYS